ncbi:MAG: hypothetical protein ABIK65_11815 [Candidatus Eisenbacteria bacterium]
MVVARAFLRSVAAAFAVSCVLLCPVPSFPSVPAESLHAVVVTIDGIRKSEFLAWNERLESWIDTAGAYVPNVVNRTRGVTDPNHAILWGSGDPNQCVNCEGHPDQPMHFELLRKERRLPPSATAFVTGKNHLIETDDCSDHPDYGMPYRATTLLVATPPPPCLQGSFPYQGPDSLIVRRAIDFLDTNGVVWMGINLSEYDFMAHLMGFTCADGDTGFYWAKLEEIYREAEHQIIDVLWPFLQNHPRYGGRTVLVVATDHGRHLDWEADGFQSHGHGYAGPGGGCNLNCAGCRDIWAMFLGPGILRGCRVGATHEIDDVAPTVRALLGFANPFEVGRPIDEVLGESVATSVGSSRGSPVVLVVDGTEPNPFRRATTIRFLMPWEGSVEMFVHDFRGRLVLREGRDRSGPGPDSFVWDGRDGRGRDSPPGVYFVTLASGGGTCTRKVTRLR